MKADRGLTVERMTELARISRAGFYRFEENAGPGGDADMDLRDAIQRIALLFSLGTNNSTSAPTSGVNRMIESM